MKNSVVKKRKSRLRIKIIAILLLLLFSSASLISPALENQRKKQQEPELKDPSEREKDIEYESFIELLSNDNPISALSNSGWKYCFGSVVTSTGRGLHIGLFRLKGGFNIPGFRSLRFRKWWFFCNYNNQDAVTTIEPLPKTIREKITINGPHSVISSVIIPPQGVFLGGILSAILRNIDYLNEEIHLFGKAFWDWGKFIRTLLYVAFPPHIPLYGFWQELTFQGYTPIVFYKE
jgi:hypothetical protein